MERWCRTGRGARSAAVMAVAVGLFALCGYGVNAGLTAYGQPLAAAATTTTTSPNSGNSGGSDPGGGAGEGEGGGGGGGGGGADTAGTGGNDSSASEEYVSNDRTETLECDGGSLTVSGNDNRLTVRDHCSKLTISGSDNRITVAATDTVKVTGARDRVIYRIGNPKVTDTGKTNSVGRQD